MKERECEGSSSSRWSCQIRRPDKTHQLLKPEQKCEIPNWFRIEIEFLKIEIEQPLIELLFLHTLFFQTEMLPLFFIINDKQDKRLKSNQDLVHPSYGPLISSVFYAPEDREARAGLP